MKCIVTAGPTYEPLDEVRRLTNFSTGQLGGELANHLTAQGHEVLLLRGHYATWRGPEHVRRTEIFTTTGDLRDRLRGLAAPDIGAVFHCAAVSDFAFGRILETAQDGSLRPVQSPKISTRQGPLLAELLPTPKIIASLRAWYPDAFLAGWKYELEGSQTDALARARRQLAECQTDVCVVNGRAYGEGYGVLTTDGRCAHCTGRQELFAALAHLLQVSLRR